ncbi:hypothetical protein BGX33_005296 [Mortierella sp. NVP41]|nr:hypothetical protein BGX33_005296 [Mortierella sp. NVP41]
MFKLEHTSTQTIGAILLHQDSLEALKLHVSGVDYDDDTKDLRGLWRPRRQDCSRLETMDLHLHEMDMDEVEKGEWACKDLHSLRVRVKGLDTKDKILKAVALWRAGCRRRWQEEVAEGFVVMDVEQNETDLSIEARVARYLVKFDKLEKVWLGYQTWTPI